jgi:hypothetical protein
MGGAGSRVIILDLADTSGCLCARSSVRASASAGGWGRGLPLVVHCGHDAEVAVGDRDARVLEQALLSPSRGPARLALRNLCIVELLEVWVDDRAVELAADAAEVGEDRRQAPQRRVEQEVEQQAKLVELGVLVGFDQLAVYGSGRRWAR